MADSFLLNIDIAPESCWNYTQGHDAAAGRMGPAPCTGCTARVCTRGAPTRGLVGIMMLQQEGGVLHWARFALVKTLPPGGWARHSAIRALSGHYGFRPKTCPMLTCGRQHNQNSHEIGLKSKSVVAVVPAVKIPPTDNVPDATPVVVLNPANVDNLPTDSV